MNSGAIEYERRYIVGDLDALPGFTRNHGHELIVQGYIAARDGAALRIRRRMILDTPDSTTGHAAPPVLEFKGKRGAASRYEHQWPVTESMAPRLMKLAAGIIEKHRYQFSDGPFLWEIDEFLGANTGLIVAELETQHPIVGFIPPSWCGLEVTPYREFDNESLALHPISAWTEAERNRFPSLQ